MYVYLKFTTTQYASHSIRNLKSKVSICSKYCISYSYSYWNAITALTEHSKGRCWSYAAVISIYCGSVENIRCPRGYEETVCVLLYKCLFVRNVSLCFRCAFEGRGALLNLMMWHSRWKVTDTTPSKCHSFVMCDVDYYSPAVPSADARRKVKSWQRSSSSLEGW